MNKCQVLLIAIAALFVAGRPLVAQHQHGGGATAGAGTATGGDFTNINPGNSTFQRAFTLQATEAQALQVRSWIQNTAALRMQLDHLKDTAQSGESRDLLNQVEALKETVQRRAMAGTRFLASLSEPQRSALKKDLKKLGEANRELSGAFADPNLTSTGTPNRKQIVKEVQKALKAISIEQNEQQRLADEMGVNV